MPKRIIVLSAAIWAAFWTSPASALCLPALSPPYPPPPSPPPPGAGPVIAEIYAQENSATGVVVWPIYGAWPGERLTIQTPGSCSSLDGAKTGLFMLKPYGIDPSGSTLYRNAWSPAWAVYDFQQYADPQHRWLEPVSDLVLPSLAPQTAFSIMTTSRTIDWLQSRVDMFTRPNTVPIFRWLVPVPAILALRGSAVPALRRQRLRRAT